MKISLSQLAFIFPTPPCSIFGCLSRSYSWYLTALFRGPVSSTLSSFSLCQCLHGSLPGSLLPFFWLPFFISFLGPLSNFSLFTLFHLLVPLSQQCLSEEMENSYMNVSSSHCFSAPVVLSLCPLICIPRFPALWLFLLVPFSLFPVFPLSQHPPSHSSPNCLLVLHLPFFLLSLSQLLAFHDLVFHWPSLQFPLFLPSRLKSCLASFLQLPTHHICYNLLFSFSSLHSCPLHSNHIFLSMLPRCQHRVVESLGETFWLLDCIFSAYLIKELKLWGKFIFEKINFILEVMVVKERL